MRVPHPALLGVTAQQMPLLSAAVHVASVRAPQAVFGDLLGASELRSPAAVTEFRRAAAWIGGKCAEPGGLGFSYQDPITGDLHRIPPSALWQADPPHSANDAADPRTWSEFAPFRAAVAHALGISDCDPTLEVVVLRAEVDAHLGMEGPVAIAWLAKHAKEVLDGLRDVMESGAGNPVAAWALSYVEYTLPMLVELQPIFERFADAPVESERTTGSTKAVVAAKEADFLRRWRENEFASAKHARDVLSAEINARRDGTVAKSGDGDFHSRPSVDRLTRGWFSGK